MSGRTAHVIRRAATGALLLSGVLIVVAFAVDPAQHGLLSAPAAIVAPIAMAIGIRVNRPQLLRAWTALTVGVALANAAELLVTMGISDATGPVASGLVLAGYLTVLCAIARIIRDDAVEGAASSLLDALIIAAGVGLLGWFPLFQEHLEAGGGTWIDGVLSVTYPSLDVALVYLAIRLLWRHRVISRSMWLLAAALLCTLIGDVGVAMTYTPLGYSPGQITDLGLRLAAVFVAAAAIDPTVGDPLRPASRDGDLGIVRMRLALIAFATFIGPAIMMGYAVLAPDGDPVDLRPFGLPPLGLELGLGALVVAALVAARLTLTVLRLERALLARERLEVELKHQAQSDSLTELPNRAAFYARLQRALSHDRQAGAILFCDLDDFKTINDTEGHETGDDLLRVVAERLHACVRANDVAARLGGDEFALLLDGVQSPLEAEQIADRVIEAFQTPVVLGGRSFAVGLSIGIAMAADAGDAAELMRQADIAMYLAKSQGKGRHERFGPRLQDSITNRLALRASLQRAIDEREFVLVYQPIRRLSAEDGNAGVEALIRWNHPDRGLVAPAEFIPVAEQSGLIVPMGAWALETACAQMRAWLDAGAARDAYVSVNVSPVQLAREGFAATVRATLARTRLDPANLVIEITESALVDFETALSVLSEIRDLGVRIAIDDFGTGYSAMSYLARFPIDILKIDRSFVSAMGRDHQSVSLVETIINLATSLHMETVAEGIEESGQLAELQRLGCSLGQGFVFSRPVPVQAAGALLIDRPRGRSAA